MIDILIVEDEESISNLLKISLTQAGYTCHTTYDGETALERINQNKYDLILLDIMLPKIDGFEIMNYIKELKIPVIFITAVSNVDNKVKGLKLGAEDYITKPFDIQELLARVEVVLRRNNKTSDKIVYKNIEIDITSHTVKKDDKIVDLTKKEFDLLLLFLKNKNVALYREVIYERIWGDEFFGDTRTVDLHIQRIRKKLNLENEIKTVYKIGYRFEVLEWDLALKYLLYPFFLLLVY